MHVYMVYNYDYYYPKNGGGIRYTHNLINFLIEEGTKVTLIGVKLSDSPSNIKDQTPRLDTIYILKNSDSALKFFIKLFLKTPFLKFKENSIIHAHRTYFLLPFILFHPKVPKVVTLHMRPLEFVKVEYPQYFRFIDRIHKIVDSFCISHINGVVAITKEVKESYLARYPWLQNKITLIEGSGVDLNKFRPVSKKEKRKLRRIYQIPQHSKVILFAGRLTKIKNVQLLIRAFKLLCHKDPNIMLVIAGRGPEEKNLKRLVKELNIENRVMFLGEIHPEEMPKVYNIADIFALTSFSEASPNVVREALACGVPVVSTNVGDIQEIIDNDLIGRVVDSYDEKELAGALLEMLELIEKKREIVKKLSLKKSMKYSIHNIIKEYLVVYKKVITNER